MKSQLVLTFISIVFGLQSIGDGFSMDMTSLPTGEEGEVLFHDFGVYHSVLFGSVKVIVVSDGSQNRGGIYSFADGEDRALGVLCSNSDRLLQFGFHFSNCNGDMISGVSVTVTYNQWRYSGIKDSKYVVHAEYSLTPTSEYEKGHVFWIPFDSLNLVSLVKEGNGGAVDSSTYKRTVTSMINISSDNLWSKDKIFAIRYTARDSDYNEALGINNLEVVPIFFNLTKGKSETKAMAIQLAFSIMVGVSMLAVILLALLVVVNCIHPADKSSPPDTAIEYHQLLQRSYSTSESASVEDQLTSLINRQWNETKAPHTPSSHIPDIPDPPKGLKRPERPKTETPDTRPTTPSTHPTSTPCHCLTHTCSNHSNPTK